MPAARNELISFVERSHGWSTDDKKLFPQTQIALLVGIGVWLSLFYLSPFDFILNFLVF